MEPLNLTAGPPRAARETLDGVIFLPRSIDKIRAALPGGDIGPYRIEGLTQTMLDMLGVPLDAFTTAVATAASDAEVVAFLRARASAEQLAAWNAFIVVREPRGGNRPEAESVMPWLRERPDLRLILDVLDEDDKQTFAPAH